MKYASVPAMRSYMRGFDRALSLSGAASFDVGGFHVESNIHGEYLHPLESDSGIVLLYIPGGGFLVRSPNAHRLLVRRLCKKVRSSACIVHYRLSPEHTFPAAVDDVVAAYRDLLESGIDPKMIIMAGDSAGGNLTLAGALALRDAGLPLPAGLIALSPVADLTFSGKSRRAHRHRDPMLPADRTDADARHYVAHHDPEHPLISPIFGDYSDIPPILLQVGSDEILLDDSVRVSEKARAAGTAVQLDIWHKMPHVWHLLPRLPEGDLAVDDIGNFIASVVTGHR